MGVTLAQALVQVPLLLVFWSPEVYSTWVAVGSAVALVSVLDSGHAAFLGNEFYRLWINDRNQLSRVLSSGLKVASVIALLQISLGVALLAGFGLPLMGFGGGSTAAQAAAAFAIYLLGWAGTISISGPIHRLYPVAGEYAITTWFSVSSKLAGFLAVIIAVACGAGVIGAMAAQISAWGFCNLITLRDAWRRIPASRPWWGHGDWSLGWRNFRASLIVSFINGCEQLSAHGLILLVSRALNPSSVILVATMRTLTNTATQASNIIMNPITPDLVKYYYRGESKKLSAVLSVSWMLNGVLVGPAIVIGLWLVAPFYRVWTRDAVSFEPLLFATLALAVCVRNWAAPLYTLLAGTNSLAPQVVIALIRALVTLGFSGLLLPAFGSSGAGCGVLAGEVLAAGYAALRIQNDVIATAGTGSQFSSALMSIISTCVVAVALGIFSYKGNVESVTSCVILATLSVIAAMQWRTLPQEVRDRILRLGLQMIRVK